jgi:hypothetical protein
MLSSAIIIAPVLAFAYYSRTPDQSVKKAEPKSDKDWIPQNVRMYLRDPILVQKAIYGDSDQISLEHPVGPVSEAMSAQSNPVDALNILGKHELEKDRTVIRLWPDFVKPTREVVFRSVDQPIVSVNILKPGTLVDKNVQTGNRFWDQPVPRSTGIDRYYKRVETVPWYLVP